MYSAWQNQQRKNANLKKQCQNSGDRECNVYLGGATAKPCHLLSPQPPIHAASQLTDMQSWRFVAIGCQMLSTWCILPPDPNTMEALLLLSSANISKASQYRTKLNF